MRNVLGPIAAVAAVAVAFSLSHAKDKADKVVTLKGEIGCPKCVFMVDGFTKCGNAIKVKQDGKEVIYILDDKGGAEPYHKEVCTASKAGSVKGVVSKKGDQMYIKPSADGVKYD